MANAVNIDSLKRAAETYQRDMRTLPYIVLMPELRAMKFNLLEVDNRDIAIVRERNGGIARPYAPGGNMNLTGEIARMKERKLETEFANASILDNVMNYKDKRVLLDSKRDKLNNKTKTHPLEQQILADMVITVGEDIIDSVWHAKRDIADITPLGMCNGIWTWANELTTAGEISVAKKNLVQCGSLAAPAVGGTDFTAYTSLKNWLLAADPKMRSKAIVLYIPMSTLLNVKDALENKKRNYADVTFDMVLANLREDCMMPKLQIVSHYAIGTGNKLMLTIPGNLDLGMNTLGDAQYVQVRNPFMDPNRVQYWMQWEIGTRITNLHHRALQISDGTISSVELSGDYNSAAGDVSLDGNGDPIA